MVSSLDAEFVRYSYLERRIIRASFACHYAVNVDAAYPRTYFQESLIAGCSAYTTSVSLDIAFIKES